MPRGLRPTAVRFSTAARLEWAASPTSIRPCRTAGIPAALNLTNSTLFAVSSFRTLRFRSAAKIGTSEFARELWAIAGSRRVAAEVAEDVLAADWTADGTEMAVIRQSGRKIPRGIPRGKVGLWKVTTPSDISGSRRTLSPWPSRNLWLLTAMRGGQSRWTEAERTDHSEVFVSVEGLAWPPSGKEVWVAATTTEGCGGRDSWPWSQWQEAGCSSVARHSSASRYIARGPDSFVGKNRGEADAVRGLAIPKNATLSWLDYATLRDLSADGAQVSFDDWGSAAGASGLAYLRKTDGSPPSTRPVG